MTADSPETLNVAQVAQLVGHDVQVIRRMAREGRLPAHQPGGQRAYVFDRDEVLEWVRAHPAVHEVAEAASSPDRSS